MAARREIREKFEIIGHLGSGGMAEVFLARQDSLERLVAIKELKPAFAENPELYERFLREARTGAALVHENIVQVHHFGESDRGPFIVLEYVDGIDLKTLIQRLGSVPPRAALPIFHAVARALAYAHGRGLVHRDVKPGNIMLGKHGEVKLMDFGIVRATDSDLTRTGAFLGTPSYMSPEQFQGEKLTPASDQFSLGIVIYEALTGVKPFRADDETSLSKKIQTQRELPPRRLNPEVPRRFQWLARRCLKKKPGQRYPDTLELLRALENLMTHQERTRGVALLAEFLSSSGALEGKERATVVTGEPKKEPMPATPISIPPAREAKSKTGKSQVSKADKSRAPAPKSTLTPEPSPAERIRAAVGPAEPEAPSLRWLWRLIMLLILILSATIAYALSDYYTPYLPKAVKTFLSPAPEPSPPPK